MGTKINKSVYVTSAIYVVLGLVMVIFPETTMKTFCLTLGAIAAVLGIINLVTYFTRNTVIDSVYRYDFVTGVVLILAGLALIVKMDKVIELIPVLLGILILVNGIIKLQHAIDLKRIEFNGWLYVLVFSLLCLSIGAICVLQPAFIAKTLIIIMGISFIFCGATDFITLFLLAKKMKEYSSNTGNDDISEETVTENSKKEDSEKADEAFVAEETEVYEEVPVTEPDTDAYSGSWSTKEPDGNIFLKDDIAGSVSTEDETTENEESVSKEDEPKEDEEPVSKEDEPTEDGEPVLKENTLDEAL
ncbi:MAG: DUF308 domain-containing protein [Lachnospiraceae bacterium]|nr:DUF308 domain-containing protein [Lachnospiraceae bacterium]